MTDESDATARTSALGPLELTELRAWGQRVRPIFDSMPYLVGSTMKQATYRDVDVRVLLPDDEFDRWFGLDVWEMRSEHPGSTHPWHDAAWTGLCIAIGTWGRVVTGLPIDFQVQRRDEANEQYRGEPRNPIGVDVFREYGPGSSR